jgi:tRNA G18 (ribose-2'-O)-methylase SpoU
MIDVLIEPSSRVERVFASHPCETHPMTPVVDPEDPRVDGYRALRARESSEIVWAEGPTVVERLLRSRHRTRSVLATPALLDRLAPHLAGRDEIDVLVAERDVIAAIVGFDLHRGAIAIGDRPAPVVLDDVLVATRLLVMVEGVNDAENLGAIGRSARGLGADALVLDPTCADPWYRRSVRVSMGELLHLPVVRARSWSMTLDEVAAAGFEVWALTPSDAAAAIGTLSRPPRVAVLVGAEGPGLSSATLSRCTNVRIPMHHGVDSLNVGHAVAAALAVVQSSPA